MISICQLAAALKDSDHSCSTADHPRCAAFDLFALLYLPCYACHDDIASSFFFLLLFVFNHSCYVISTEAMTHCSCFGVISIHSKWHGCTGTHCSCFRCALKLYGQFDIDLVSPMKQMQHVGAAKTESCSICVSLWHAVECRSTQRVTMNRRAHKDTLVER